MTVNNLVYNALYNLTTNPTTFEMIPIHKDIILIVTGKICNVISINTSNNGINGINNSWNTCPTNSTSGIKAGSNFDIKLLITGIIDSKSSITTTNTGAKNCATASMTGINIGKICLIAWITTFKIGNIASPTSAKSTSIERCRPSKPPTLEAKLF